MADLTKEQQEIFDSVEREATHKLCGPFNNVGPVWVNKQMYALYDARGFEAIEDLQEYFKYISENTDEYHCNETNVFTTLYTDLGRAANLRYSMHTARYRILNKKSSFQTLFNEASKSMEDCWPQIEHVDATGTLSELYAREKFLNWCVDVAINYGGLINRDTRELSDQSENDK